MTRRVRSCASLTPITGLYYVRNRWYDPVAARFVSEDPIGLAGGINLYAYVGNSPTNLRDPSGLRVDCPPGSQPVEITVEAADGSKRTMPGCKDSSGRTFIPLSGLTAAVSDWWREHSGPYVWQVKARGASEFYRLEAQARSLEFQMEVMADLRERERAHRERCNSATTTFAIVWAVDGLSILSGGIAMYGRPLMLLTLGAQRWGAMNRGSPSDEIDWRYLVPMLAVRTAQKQMEAACGTR